MPDWTPGPWSYDGLTIRTDDPAATLDDRVLHGGRGGMYVREEDARLMALAPEIAEAILAWAADWSEHDATRPSTRAKLDALAERLRGGGEAR